MVRGADDGFIGEGVLEGRDLVRFTIVAHGEVLQRRDYVRVEAVQPVVLGFAPGEAAINAHAIDVSGGGMLLTGADSRASPARAARWGPQPPAG